MTILLNPIQLCFIICYHLLANHPHQFYQLKWGGHQQLRGWVFSFICIHFPWENSLQFFRSPEVRQLIRLRAVHTWAQRQPPQPHVPGTISFAVFTGGFLTKLVMRSHLQIPSPWWIHCRESAGLQRAHVTYVFQRCWNSTFSLLCPPPAPPPHRQRTFTLSFPVSLKNLSTVALPPSSLCVSDSKQYWFADSYRAVVEMYLLCGPF